MSGPVLWGPDVEGLMLSKVQERLFLLAEALERQSQVFKGPAPGVGHGLTDDELDDVSRWDEFFEKLRAVNEEVEAFIVDLNYENDEKRASVSTIRGLFSEMAASLLALFDPIVSAVILYGALIFRLELLDEVCRAGMTSVDDFCFALRQ